MRCEGATVVHGHSDPRGPAVGPSGGVRNGLDIRSLLASIGTVNSDQGVDMELTDSAGAMPVGDQLIIKGLNAQNFRHQFQHQLQQQQQQQHAYGAVLAAADTSLECSGGIDDVATTAAAGSLSPTRRSANMTERVPVPSSEHVAEIVGRQGCKIKALRNKTNTYIKTPVRGEEPVFVVTGRREDVDAARREIISAAEHFSHIRAARSTAGNTGSSRHTHHNGVHRSSRQENCNDVVLRNQRSPSPASATGSKNGGSGCGSNVSDRHSGVVGNQQQQVTIGVRVPMSMVGLVVGPKGATVKRIQQDTGTYIVTPGRQKDPVFEVIGSPDGVEKAKRQIEAYLETRLGPSVVTSSNTGFCGEWLGTSSTPTSGTTEALDRSSTSSLSSASSSSSSSFECGNMRSVSDVQLSPSQSDLDSSRLSSGSNVPQGHCSHAVKQSDGWLKENNAAQFMTTPDRLRSGTNGFTSISPILPAPRTSGEESQPYAVGNSDPEALLSWFVNRMCLSNGGSSLPPMSSSYDLLHHSVSIADTLQTNWPSSLCPDRNIDQQYFIDNQFPASVSTFPGKRFDNDGVSYDLDNESSTKWNVLLAAAAAGLLTPSSAGVIDSHRRSTPVEFDDFSAGHPSSSDGFGFDYDRLESDLVCPGRLKGSVNSNGGRCWADQSTSGTHQLSALAAARSEECGVSSVSGFVDTSASFGVKFGSSDEASTSSMSPVESFLKTTLQNATTYCQPNRTVEISSSSSTESVQSRRDDRSSPTRTSSTL